MSLCFHLSLNSDRNQAIEAGCCDFIAKPVRMKPFLDCIQANMPVENRKPPAKR